MRALSNNDFYALPLFIVFVCVRLPFLFLIEWLCHQVWAWHTIHIYILPANEMEERMTKTKQDKNRIKNIYSSSSRKLWLTQSTFKFIPTLMNSKRGSFNTILPFEMTFYPDVFGWRETQSVMSTREKRKKKVYRFALILRWCSCFFLLLKVKHWNSQHHYIQFQNLASFTLSLFTHTEDDNVSAYIFILMRFSVQKVCKTAKKERTKKNWNKSKTHNKKRSKSWISCITDSCT